MEISKALATGAELDSAVKRDGLTPVMDVMEVLVAIPGMNVVYRVWNYRAVRPAYQKLIIFK